VAEVVVAQTHQKSEAVVAVVVEEEEVVQNSFKNVRFFAVAC
jgi:hypothetical protein